MSSIRFFLLFLFLTAICFSPVTARADYSIIPGLSGSFASVCCDFGVPGFSFYADDGTTDYGEMISPLIPSDDFSNNSCNPVVSPCYATWSGAKVGMYFEILFTNEIFGGVVTQGQYSGYAYYDGYSFMEEESGWFDFVGTWDGLNPAWVGKGSISYGSMVECSGNSCNFPGYTLSGNIVTTIAPEPSSFVLICTGVLGFAGAMRRRILP